MLCVVFLFSCFMTIPVDCEKPCGISETYKSILRNCLPAVLNAALDDRLKCSSIDSYWTCVKHVSAVCNVPVSGLIFDLASEVIKDLVCSGTRLNYSLPLQIFGIVFCYFVLQKHRGYY
ncbi:uncharacterized protein LOC133204234 [Saccostrea echinata]|uniref:uncharacterized protein LOC133204234 n=1 Tax=Saccostrea echinata TaxID=191078 RepID=UPI002A82A551|nr:uncharacterized protein LOC133204234 [Saccostrea echinata]